MSLTFDLIANAQVGFKLLDKFYLSREGKDIKTNTNRHIL